MDAPLNLVPLSFTKRAFLLSAAFLFVAFGQPAWVWWFGIVAAAVGYALIWRVVLEFSSWKQRFWLGTLWFTAVQMLQLSWLVSHPYLYIYPVFIVFSFAIGAQFGIICLFITRKNLSKIPIIAAIAAIWTLLEWVRLYFFSGFTWNPVGMALTGSVYSLQMASLWGIYGLSFWVVLVNLLGLSAWLQKLRWQPVAFWAVAAFVPYVYGFSHYTYHHKRMVEHEQKKGEEFNALLVQTAFPAEEILDIQDKYAFIGYVLDEWKQILTIVQKHQGKKLDLITLPEFVVPFGTYTFVYPVEQVMQAFEQILGPDSLKALPPLKSPLAHHIQTTSGPQIFVNNAYWSQAIANAFETPLIVGLEDAEEVYPGEREYYSSAMYFKPFEHATAQEIENSPFASYIKADRYAKRVLVPMGEYIPFDFLKKLAAKYGVQGSFTNGKEAKVLSCGKIPFGVSICYEETFGHLMRESRLLGAEMLVNLTSDVWYPDSRLPQQHFDHARLRTVESGIPLLRSCNTGITCAVDSLGVVVDTLGGEDIYALQWVSDALYVTVPTYHYRTIYSYIGDALIIPLSFLFASFFLLSKGSKIE